jgi:hypothetical protein
MKGKGLKLILQLIISDREVQRLSKACTQEHARRLQAAVEALQREMLRNGNNILKASTKVFHAHCNRTSCCCVHEDFEKEVLNSLSMAAPLQQQQEPPATKFRDDFTLERNLKKELAQVIKTRNDTAYEIIQQYFARAHAKLHFQGEESLDPAERLLCDYDSVVQLRLASDPEILFQRVATWLCTRIPKHCRTCGIHFKKKKGIKCLECKCECFCSVKCQINDEANRAFCHARECGLVSNN